MSDVFLGVRSQVGNFKVSFHDSGECHAGATLELATRSPELVGGPRHRDKWHRAIGATSDLRDTYRIVVPGFALRQEPPAPDLLGDVRWLEPPGLGECCQVSISFVDAGAAEISPLVARAVTGDLCGWRLPNGERVIVRRTILPVTDDVLQAYRHILTAHRDELARDLPADADSEPLRVSAAFRMSDGVRAMLDLPYPLPPFPV